MKVRAQTHWVQQKELKKYHRRFTQFFFPRRFASQSLSKKKPVGSHCKDYDELATGQRREGQFTMARDLVPKICEIPADALPFLLMSCSFASQWDRGPNGNEFLAASVFALDVNHRI